MGTPNTSAGGTDRTVPPDYTDGRPPPPPPQPLEGEAVPGYVIHHEIARGGMGIVYRARHVLLDLDVALKVMRRHDPGRPDDLRRFHVEAAAVARLDHPNIVRLYDFAEHGGRPYFSMELADGSLDRRLAGRPLPCAEAARLVEQLAHAAHAAHRANIVHRDLKPANVLLMKDGTPKLADFGLARRLDAPTDETGPDAVLGTASYMAPEQALGAPGLVGPAADVWALGAVLYECLTGRPPFRAESRDLTVVQVLLDEPARPALLRPDVPPDLEAVCLKCLEKAPDLRYESAAELAGDLAAFLGGRTLTVRPPTEWERQKRWAAAAGYELLDLAGCTTYGLVFTARQPGFTRLVTLLTVSSRAQADPRRMARLRHEAEVFARLDHPNIVRFNHFHEHLGRPFLALEHVDGGTLAELCGRPMPPVEAAALVEQLARATHAAHEAGVVHSDLRPFNVLLTRSGMPKVAGFALAQVLDQEGPRRRARRTLSGYMAPEQAAGRAATPASDVYALGAILYQLLCGEPPFVAETVAETLEMVRGAEPPPPRELVPCLSSRLEAACLRCLSKRPEDRPESARALADELKRYRENDQTKTVDFELVPGYAVLAELGRGGTGVVHRAWQKSVEREVALKVFYEGVRHVLAASRAVAQLHHPNLVHVIDCGERDGRLFVVEELIDGGHLGERIARGPLAPADAAGTAEVLARVLHHAHRHGIVHRNLKPQVVLLAADGTPKVSSFDLAKLLHSPGPEPSGRIAGTMTYMAPEQAAGLAATPASDVYALGAILYEMLTGRPPFVPASADPVELLGRVQREPPAPPRQFRPEVPAELEAVCLRCLEKVPGRRYGSAEELAEALRGFLRGPPTRDGAPVRGFWRRLLGWFGRPSGAAS